MIPPKEMTHHVPITVSEIIEDVHAAFELGITMVHLHTRDESTGEPTYRAEVLRNIIEGIRNFSKDLVVCVSFSGRSLKQFEKRSEPLQIDGDLKPDMGSLTLSSVSFNRKDSINSPKMIQSLARNIDLIRRIHTLAYANERKIMPDPEFRTLLNLEKGHGKYGRKYQKADLES